MLELPLLVALFQELGVVMFDARKARQKKRLIDAKKKRHQCQDFLSATRLWLARQIASNDGFLMENTELNREGRKQAFYQGNRAFAAINGDAGEAPFLCHQMPQSLLDNGQRFALHFLPENVASAGAIHHQAVAASEEGSVEGQRDGRGGNCRRMP